GGGGPGLRQPGLHQPGVLQLVLPRAVRAARLQLHRLRPVHLPLRLRQQLLHAGLFPVLTAPARGTTRMEAARCSSAWTPRGPNLFPGAPPFILPAIASSAPRAAWLSFLSFFMAASSRSGGRAERASLPYCPRAITAASFTATDLSFSA